MSALLVLLAACRCRLPCCGRPACPRFAAIIFRIPAAPPSRPVLHGQGGCGSASHDAPPIGVELVVSSTPF